MWSVLRSVAALALALARAGRTADALDYLGALEIVLYAEPGDPFVTPPSRAQVNSACASAALTPNINLTCVAAFAVIGYTTDVFPAGGNYASPPFVYGATVPPVLISPAAPVLDKHGNPIAANWSALWYNNTLKQGMSVITSPSNAYALGIWPNGTLAPNCANWFLSFASSATTTSVDTTAGETVFTTGALNFPCTGSNNPTLVCACVPPFPTASPTSKSPTLHPTTGSPTAAPTTSLPTAAPTAAPTVARTETVNVDLVVGLCVSLGLVVVVGVLVGVSAVTGRGRGARARATRERRL